jgi:probable F420-dependent oxidoreductase
MRAFRFGVQGPPAFSEPQWNDFVRRAEDHGYDVVSLADHFDGRPGPLVALAYAAAVTDRIRLGTAVLAVDFRNPAVLVQDVATLDELSRERVELGIGAGWKEADYVAAGLRFDPPAARIDRLDALLPALRQALRPGLPVLIGGGGRRMLEVAARHADIVGLVPTNRGGVSNPWGVEATVAGFGEKVASVREMAGPRAAQLELHTRVFATADGAAADAIGVDAAAASPMSLVRPARAMADKLLRLRDELGLTYYTVSAPFLDEFASVIDLLRDR